MADVPQDPLAAHAASAPDRIAVIEGDATGTYAGLNQEVNRLANGLRSLGATAGERLIWCAPNSREVLVIMHACRKVGLVAVPMSYRFTPAEMQFVVSDSDASIVLVDAEQAPALAAVRDTLPDVRDVVVLRGSHPPFVSWSDLLAGSSAEEPPLPDPGGLGAAMQYTSGTTGRPRGAVRTQTDRAHLGAMLGELNFGSQEVHITSGPLYHAGPNAFALITQLLGGTVVAMRYFDPAEWVRLVTQHRVTSTFCTPTHLKRILALPAEVLATGDFTSLRTVIANAAPVPYELKQGAIATLGEGFLYEVYGATELGIIVILRPEDQLRKPGSCGRPYGAVELRIVGPGGEDLPAGQVGEVMVKTPHVIDGYHKSEPVGEWLSVGDIGRVDDEGYLYLCDRQVDLVITGGANVYPAEVEAALHAHPDVCDVAVYGVPDDEWGERVHAVVQAWPGRDVDIAELETFLGDRLAGYKRPRSWEVHPELPRTDSGKLLRRVLRERHWAGHERQV